MTSMLSVVVYCTFKNTCTKSCGMVRLKTKLEMYYDTLHSPATMHSNSLEAVTDS